MVHLSLHPPVPQNDVPKTGERKKTEVFCKSDPDRARTDDP
ncbi:hypothetical protein EVA_00518, partial [gut metagenome]